MISGENLYFLPEELKTDRAIVLEAVSRDGNALRFSKIHGTIPTPIKFQFGNDKPDDSESDEHEEFHPEEPDDSSCVESSNFKSLCAISSWDIVSAAIRRSWESAQLAPLEPLRDPDFVRNMIQQSPDGWRALRWLSMDLRTHRGLLRLAIQHSPEGEALRDFCLALRDEKETVKNDIVNQKPLALRWVSLRLRGDKDVVLAAVRKDGRALEWATLSLREN